ncbi:putative transporter [Rhodococcoides trifolii]|uniref:Transporter n=1 Tax=Rhodococcoides trifolii TaxID=908250 RepID=A0A917G4U0_9NOCA|nr:MFS transporter [Rhodococcus trifolii]GGG22905.1 putative transporter [Rhodococcus trifolii]
MPEMTTAQDVLDTPHRRGSVGYRRITLALFAAGLATFVAMYCVQALLPALTDAFGVSPAVSALAVSVTTGVLALAIIPASVLSERYGRTRVMVASALASSVIGLLLPLSPTIEVLLVGRAIQGATLAGIPAVAMAYLAEEVHGNDLGAAMGRYVAGTTIGGLLGRVVPSGVLDLGSWRWALESAAAVALVCSIVLMRGLPRSRFFREQRIDARTVLSNLRGHLADPTLRILFALGFILMGGFVSVYNFLGFRLTAAPFGLPQGIVGLIFVMYLAGTWSSTAAGRLADRMGRARVLLASVGITVAGLALTVPDSLPFVLVGVFLFTAGFFAAHSVASGWVGRVATTHRAEASALYLCAYYLGSSIAGALAGVAWGIAEWAGTATFVAGLLVVAILLALRMFRVNAGSDRKVTA